MAKRTAVLLIMLTLALACRGQTGRVVTFAVGGDPTALQFWEGLAREFEADTGIHVELLRLPADTDQVRQSLVIALKAGQPNPDLMVADVAWVAQLARAGWLEPLDPYLAKEPGFSDLFLQNVLDLADRYDGKLLAMPLFVDAGVLYYRKDLLEQHGFAPPETWDELYRQAREIGKADPHEFYGFVWQGAQYEGLICGFLEFLAGADGGIGLVAGKVELSTPENLKALRFMRKLIETGISPPNTYTEMREEQVRHMFQKGRALFERNWPYAWVPHESSGSAVAGRTGFAPLPRFGPGPPVATLGGWHVAMSRQGDAKDETWLFVRFLLSYEIQKRFALELGWNPGREDVYKDSEVVAAYPHMAEIKKILATATARPSVPYYSLMSLVLQQHVNAALAGQVTPKQALDAAQTDLQRIVDRYEGE